MDAPTVPSGDQGTARGYDHDHFKTMPVDIAKTFAAFAVSFDGPDDGSCLAVPEWVAYELRATPPNLGAAPARPSRWVTDSSLHDQRVAPDDDSYKGSGYSRGHMCMKSHAHRISDQADRETHTVLNACPQLQGVNNGVWRAVEGLTGAWADSFGTVWIVTGPVFLANKQHQWIGDAGEVPVAVPDAFFKVVAKERGNTCDVLAFLVPMEGDENHGKSSADVRPYLTSVDVLEALTGLNFLTALPDPLEDALERRIYTDLWSSSLTSQPDLVATPPAPQPEGESDASKPDLPPGATERLNRLVQAGAEVLQRPVLDEHGRSLMRGLSPEDAKEQSARALKSYIDAHPEKRTEFQAYLAGTGDMPLGWVPQANVSNQEVAKPAAHATDQLAGVTVRGGANPAAAEELLAKKIKLAGWEYVMPRPKSAQASWGNSDGRTTWWSGHWKNTRLNTYSSAQPTEASGWKGDGIQKTGWSRGGAPRRPTMIEWLCSTDGGVAPR